jgi:hypothetical protein
MIVSRHLKRSHTMKFEEAKKLVAERGASKYSGTKLTLLQKLTNGLYEKSEQRPVETRIRTKRIATVKGWVGGKSDTQLRRAFREIEELEIISRDNGTITYRMRFDKLHDVQTALDISNKRIKEFKADRASKAREQRAINRALVADLVQRNLEDEKIAAMNVSEIVAHGAKLFELAAAV